MVISQVLPRRARFYLTCFYYITFAKGEDLTSKIMVIEYGFKYVVKVVVYLLLFVFKN